MSSWQFYALNFMIRLNRALFDRPGPLDVAKSRRNTEGLAGIFKPLVPIQASPLTANGVPAEWISPQGELSERVMLYLHGGSFNAGSVHSHYALTGSVAFACKARALSIDYRLAPEFPFPAALEDTLAAYEWLLEQGILPSQIIVCGDSAGGGLTLALLIHLRDLGKPLPAAAVAISPVTDLTLEGDTWRTNCDKDILLIVEQERTSVQLYLNGADPCHPLASPLYADLHGLPPTLIQVGGDECLLADAQRYTSRAREAGSPVELDVWNGMGHEWQFGAKFMPEGRGAIEKIGQFVERVMPRKPG